MFREERMKKKITAVIAMLIALSALPACRAGGNEAGSTDGGSETESGEMYTAEYLPDKKYDGYAIRSLTIQDSKYIVLDIDSAEANKASYAQYTAIEKIKNRFGFDVTENYVASWPDCSTELRTYVDVQDDEYDLNLLIHREGFNLGIQGYLADYGDLPYCQTDRPWYATEFNDAHTVAGYTFFNYSYACVATYSGAMGVVFNKNMLNDLKLDNPYQLVADNGWTIEKMFEMAAAAKQDLNNDGVIREGDKAGICGEGDMTYPTIWIGAGLKTIEKDEQGTPVFTAPNDEKLFDILTLCVENLNKEVLFDVTVYNKDTQRETALSVFSNGDALFRFSSMGGIAQLDEMKDDFGMVPSPKKDETQKQYLSRVCDAWTFMVPSTCTRLEETSVFLEPYAVESLNYVVDAYYREILKNRYSQDEETKDMLDIIRETATLDLGDTFWQANARNKILQVIWSGTTSFGSAIASQKAIVDSLIDDAVSRIENMKK